MTIKRLFHDIIFGPINSASAFDKLPYLLVFKTTNYCWFKCPHCCEKSGPDQEKSYIPAETICNFLKQAIEDPKFIKSVVFTGGEIFSSYKFGDKQYIPTLLRFSANNNIGIDIKTNAGWANTSFGREIFQDLKDVIKDIQKNEFEVPKIQISLSLDKYHTNCFENNIKVIQELNGLPVIIHLSSFTGQEDLVRSFEDKISKTFKINGGYTLDGKETPYKFIGDKTLYYSSQGNLFAGGRASKMVDAYEIEFPQFAFIQNTNTHDHHTVVAFDNFGRVTLGENSGRKIMTPWLDEYRNEKTLAQIKKELRKNCLKEDLYFWHYEHWFHSL